MHDLFAVVFLISSTLFVSAIVVTSFLRSHYTATQFVLDWLSYLLLRLLWRAAAKNSIPAVPGEGAVLIANHRSSVDPFFIHLAAKRRVRWMVAREYCEHPMFGWFLKQTGAIPTRRGGIDNAAVRQAVNLLRDGEWIGILPEGRINLTERFMLPVRPGAALVARKAKVPLIPIYIDGAPFAGQPASPFIMSAKVGFTFGNRIDPVDFEDDQSAILAAVKEIARVAGVMDFEATIAGRNWRPSDEQIRADHHAFQKRKQAERQSRNQS